MKLPESYSQRHPNEPQKLLYSNPALKSLLAGAITGGIEITITYPTEYIKTNIQLDERGERQIYNGSIDCLRKTIQNKGILGLYHGYSVFFYGSLPKMATRFCAFELIKNRLKGPTGQLETAGSRIISGMGAGIAEAILVSTPMETLTVRLINDRRGNKPEFSGTVHAIAKIIEHEGFSGLYKGLTPMIFRQSTNQALRFLIMDTLKFWYRGEQQDKHVPKSLTGIFGILAGVTSAVSNNPVDVVKTRMQGLDANRYKNVFHCFQQILLHEGVGAFYKGMTPRCVQVALDVAITFMVYDSIMEFFEDI